MRGLNIDKAKLKVALLKRDLKQTHISIENNYSKFWLTSMVSRGHLSDAAVEVLKKYGVTEEEIRA